MDYLGNHMHLDQISTKEESKALEESRRDKDRIILTADKGGSTNDSFA